MKFNEMQQAPEYIGRFSTLIQMKGGRIMAVDKRRLDETPFFLMTNPPNNEVSYAAGRSSLETAMRLSGEGPMQLSMLGVYPTSVNSNLLSLVRLFTRDGNQPVMLMNSPLHISTLFGPGGSMYPLPEALYCDEDRALSVVFTNLDTESAANTRIVAVGAKYTKLQEDPSLVRVKERLKDSQFDSIPYWYGLDKTKASLSAFQSAQYQITIDGSHNFEIHQLSYFSNGTFSLDIVDLTKGESLIQAPRGTHYETPNLMLCGNGSYPYRLNEPVIVYGGQRLLVSLTDTSGAGNTVYLTLGGRALKIRKWG